MTISIPLPSVPDSTQTTSLDGRDYRLRFLWNQREDTWFFSIADGSGSPIASGIKVVVGADLLGLVTDTRAPAGAIIAIDGRAVPSTALIKTLAVDPGFDDLGDAIRLVYASAAEIEAL